MISYLKTLISNTLRYFNYEVHHAFQENKLVVYRTGCGITTLLWLWELSKQQTSLGPIQVDIEDYFFFHSYWFFW